MLLEEKQFVKFLSITLLAMLSASLLSGCDAGQNVPSLPSSSTAATSRRESAINFFRERKVLMQSFKDHNKDTLDIQIWIGDGKIGPADLDRLKGLGTSNCLTLIGPGPSIGFLEAMPGTNLVFLSLLDTDTSDADLDKMPTFPVLETFELRQSPIGAGGMAALLRQPALTTLNFNDQSISAEAISVLKQMPKLSELQLFGCQLSREAWREVAALGQLVSIDISFSNIDDEAMAEIAKNPKLVDVFASHTKLGDDAIEDIGGMTQLEHLDLSGCAIDDNNIGFLRDIPSLESLDISETKISDKSVELLSTSRSLLSIDLSNTSVTDQCVESLMAMEQLLSVFVEGSNISKSGRRSMGLLVPFNESTADEPE